MGILKQDTYGVIYKITNKINGKCYIGQTVNTFNKRYECKGEGIERVYNYHVNKAKYNEPGYNKHLISSIKKYGFDNFEVDEIFDVAYSKEELNNKEIYWIEYFDSRNNGYNHTHGGEGGAKKRIICLTNNEIYNSISEVKNKFKCDSFDIFRPKVGRNTGKFEGKDLLWMKYDDYLKYTFGEDVIQGEDDLLENMADYLIDNGGKTNVKIYTKNSYKRFERLKDSSVNDNYRNVIKSKDMDIVNDYVTLRLNIIDMYQTKERYNDLKCKLKGKVNLFGLSEKLKKMSRELREDIQEVEGIFIARTINFKTKTEYNEIYVEDIDLSEPEIVKYLLKMDKMNPTYTDSVIDLENIISKCNFTKIQLNVMSLWRSGLGVTQISEKMNVSKTSIQGHIQALVNKIVKQYKSSYETDFYYLNVEKGDYKKCNTCGEIRLINEFYSDGRGYYKPKCKCCRSKKVII